MITFPPRLLSLLSVLYLCALLQSQSSYVFCYFLSNKQWWNIKLNLAKLSNDEI